MPRRAGGTLTRIDDTIAISPSLNLVRCYNRVVVLWGDEPLSGEASAISGDLPVLSPGLTSSVRDVVADVEWC
jgi:hypothetical protein